MFHMLTCFNLVPETTINQFRRALVNFTEHMTGIDLVDSMSPIGRRQRHEVMDTA